MTIRVQETLGKGTVDLEPRDSGKVSIYVCGPTVYNFIHIGNARTFVWFDQIRRYLSYRGYDVTYVMNYTDVDDKIIERANVEGISPDAITSKYARAFEEDMAALGVTPPDVLALATTHIEDMVEAIEGLVEKGVAYEAEGDVFFSVEKFPGYGKLSGRSLDDMRAGERIEPQETKKYPLDFALWKSAKEGEPSWSSPWGPGRPGWHIECSVMSTKYLGMGFDIHGGASDLIFPHHENEIAQAEALFGEEPFVRHWLHAGLVQVAEEKMSKSLGNFVLARDVIERYPGEVARYWALMGSYRSQVIFSEASLTDAAQSYDRWSIFVDSTRHVLGEAFPQKAEKKRTDEDSTASGYVQRFVEAMDDDFNSAQAFAVVHELVKEGNKRLEAVQRDEPGAKEELIALVNSFLEITDVLGFEFASAGGDSELLAGLVEYLLELRGQARAEKAFDRADAIRDRLQALGVTIEDTSAGARWRLSAAQT
ncbi:MAG TPA: cysteine--tRNA ligase [Actinomycetota bacterium]|nr:cysteine--tRNA ligase [Actinomycetota bacterium]